MELSTVFEKCNKVDEIYCIVCDTPRIHTSIQRSITACLHDTMPLHCIVELLDNDDCRLQL